jgi:hypothetical protein
MTSEEDPTTLGEWITTFLSPRLLEALDKFRFADNRMSRANAFLFRLYNGLVLPSIGGVNLWPWQRIPWFREGVRYFWHFWGGMVAIDAQGRNVARVPAVSLVGLRLRSYLGRWTPLQGWASGSVFWLMNLKGDLGEVMFSATSNCTVPDRSPIDSLSVYILCRGQSIWRHKLVVSFSREARYEADVTHEYAPKSRDRRSRSFRN